MEFLGQCRFVTGIFLLFPRRLTHLMIPVQVTFRPLQASPGYQISERHHQLEGE